MENHPCFRLFNEINYHNSRLAVLGIEAETVLDDMKNQGLPAESLDIFYDVARIAAGLEKKISKNSEEKETKRCKWWNRGYCKEKNSCTFVHEKEDCKDHLNGSCTNRGCKTLRHRKQCRYFSTVEGCHRRDRCEYLHVAHNKEEAGINNEKTSCDKEVQTKDNNEVKGSEALAKDKTESEREIVEEETQTVAEKKCNCEEDFEQSDIIIKEDKIICVMKRANCSEAEWRDYEEKVESEMDLKDLLEDLGKVIEAAHRLSERKKGEQLVENNINEKFVEPNMVKDVMECESKAESWSTHIENTTIKTRQVELCPVTIKEGWLYCDSCEYKCKKKNTIKKHMRTKHSQCLSCDECGKKFASEYSLEKHKEKEHEEIENESDQSFVFSESMLDEFL